MLSMLPNEFESSFQNGMLKEHLVLAKAIGIENLIIVANKMDLIKWNKDLTKKHISEVVNFLVKTLKWDKTKIQVAPVDAYSGIGLTNRDNMPEWTKMSLYEHIKIFPPYVLDNNKKIKRVVNKITVHASILGLNCLITKMYKCIMHYDEKEIEITVDDIFNTDKKIIPFIRPPSDCILQLSFDNNIEISEKCRIILRKNDFTVGYGIIE